MDRHGDVEFVSDGAAPEPADDVLTLGRRRVPLWAWVVAGAVVVALVAVAIVSRPSAHHPVASPSSSPSVASLPAAEPRAALAVAVAGGTTWVLRDDGRILMLDSDLRPARTTAQVPIADGTTPYPTPRLLVDAPAGLLWVVYEGAARNEVLELDARTLLPVRILGMAAVRSAAVLSGHLYLISGGQLVDVPRTGAPRDLGTSPTGGFYGVAADTSHARVLATDSGFPTRVWTYTPGGRLTRTATRIAMGKGTIAVADGHAWIGGYAPDHAILGPLPAGASSVVHNVPLATMLGPGAVLVAAGEHVVWVRDGGVGSQLWCVDAETGQAVQQWSIDGDVASTVGVAVVATTTGPQRLDLRACRG
jgi:hypothetical protein